METNKVLYVMVSIPGAPAMDWILANTPEDRVILRAQDFDPKGKYAPGDFIAPGRTPLASRAMDDQFMRLVVAGTPTLVVNNYNIKIRDRKLYMLTAKMHGYKVYMVIPPYTLEECVKNAKDISPEVVEMCFRRQKLSHGVYTYDERTTLLKPLS